MPSPPLTLRLLCNLLTSHGKLYSVFQISLTHVRETSRGKTSNLHSKYRHYLHCCICSVYWILFCYANSSYNLCLIMFVFLRPEICRRLPSDSTSRWTPLPLANGWQLIAPITDLNRQIYSSCSAHIKKGLSNDRKSFEMKS